MERPSKSLTVPSAVATYQNLAGYVYIGHIQSHIKRYISYAFRRSLLQTQQILLYNTQNAK